MLLTGECRPLSCRERHCTLTRQGDLTSTRIVYQHGDNPEAVLEIDGYAAGVVYRKTAMRFLSERLDGLIPPAALEDWVERVHEYEDERDPRQSGEG